jgi:dTDP-4-amino-4,6-dideoxygalactose transaminase
VEFRAGMRERTVSPSGSVYDVPMHLQPVFEHMELEGLLPISEDVCVRHLCLPIYYGMTDEQVEHVIATVRDIVSKMGGN